MEEAVAYRRTVRLARSIPPLFFSDLSDDDSAQWCVIWRIAHWSHGAKSPSYLCVTGLVPDRNVKSGFASGVDESA